MAPTIRSEPRMQENIKILLQALRDPKNRQLRDSIRHALRAAGLTKGEISSYEITGNFPDDSWPSEDLDDYGLRREFKDDLDEIDSEFDRMQNMVGNMDFSYDEPTFHVRRRKAIRNIIVIPVFVGLVVFGILFAVLTFDEDKKTEPSTGTIPSITETAPVEDGDKL